MNTAEKKVEREIIKMNIPCWNCNKEIPDNILQCPHCRAMIDSASVQSKKNNRKPPPGMLVAGMIVADRYEIKGEIGRGGMGIVYKATDRYMGRTVAVKVIPQELTMDPRAIADLKRETSIALDLTHEHIVRLYNLDTWQGLTFVTMEYVPCGTLSHLLMKRDGKLPLDEAIVLLEQIAAALDFSHNRSPAVIHRDLKPMNILMTKRGDAKVSDFGLARFFRDLAARVTAWEAMGTLAYMAPEQMRGKDICAKTDIYSLAVLAYEMISGMPPYNTGDLRWQIMYEDMPVLEDQPNHINKALAIGMAKDINQRPESAIAFVNMLSGKLSIPEIDLNQEAQVEKTSPEENDVIVEHLEMEDENGKKEDDIKIEIETSKPELESDIAPKKEKANFKINDIMLKNKKAPEPEEVKEKEPPQKKTRGPKVVPETVLLSKAAREQSNSKPIIYAVVAIIFCSVIAYGAWKIRVPVVDVSPPPSGPTKIQAEITHINETSIEITSKPTKANVYLDSELVGVTPIILRNLNQGERELILTKESFTPWLHKITINPEVPSNSRPNSDASQIELPSYDQNLESTEYASAWKDSLSGIEFVKVPGGCFYMGNSRQEIDRVCVNSFWLGKYEITHQQWKMLMQNDFSIYQNMDNFPVENTSWEDVNVFIQKLNQLHNNKHVFRLPTEAEWEYASKSGGAQFRYSGSNDIDYVAWYVGNSDDRIHVVGTKTPNGFGLFDMSGNVSEWVLDGYDGGYRVFKGGNWSSHAEACMTFSRSQTTPDKRSYLIGFRLLKEM